MAILYQFVLRLAFGLAFAMAITPPKLVTSGYFRNHLYVTLGLSVLATLVAFSDREQFDFAMPLTAAVLSYVGSVCWLYEKPRAGRIMLGLVAAAALWGACQAAPANTSSPLGAVLWRLDAASAGLVLGSTIAAMFLGHWYLNTPTMQLSPLRRLLLLVVAAILVRAVISGTGATLQWKQEHFTQSEMWFLALRWSAGIVATLVLCWMTWKTLEIPNTQSATGILYVAVITTFTGELAALLLSTQSSFPL